MKIPYRCFTLMLLPGLIFFPAPAQPLHAEELSSDIQMPGEEDTESGMTTKVITKIPQQRFLNCLSTQYLSSAALDTGWESLKSDISVYASITEYSDTGEILQEYSHVLLDIQWEQDVTCLSPGEYSIIGHILAPDGCTFAENVITQFTLPLTVLDADIPIEIKSVTYETDIYIPILLKTGDQEALEAGLESRTTSLARSEAITDYTLHSYHLCLDTLDLSQIDISAPGEYYITATLKVSDNSPFTYHLPDSLKSVQLPVIIYEDQDLVLYQSSVGKGAYQLSFLNADSEKTCTLEYVCALQALSLEELADAQWTDNISSIVFYNAAQEYYTVRRGQLNQESYYYFRLVNGERYSNILVYSPVTQMVSLNTGDRDGGDSNIFDDSTFDRTESTTPDTGTGDDDNDSSVSDPEVEDGSDSDFSTETEDNSASDSSTDTEDSSDSDSSTDTEDSSYSDSSADTEVHTSSSSTTNTVVSSESASTIKTDGHSAAYDVSSDNSEIAADVKSDDSPTDADEAAALDSELQETDKLPASARPGILPALIVFLLGLPGILILWLSRRKGDNCL